MEMAYHDLNQSEYELTKHVSLLQVDPLALIQLRTTGRCTVQLPEALFDMDGPGHYFRRIKTVAVSIPCVTGPYASVNCTLTLLKSSIRQPKLIAEHHQRSFSSRALAPGRAFEMSPRRGAERTD
jgi:receptor-binding and translocation channel-forming TcA subunit of Tc toxin